MTAAIDEAFICDAVPRGMMDQLWAAGWRHFGPYFFRYSQQTGPQGELQRIAPLRIDVAACTFTRSQRRVLGKNLDLRCEVTSACLSEDLHALFDRHRKRFIFNQPQDLQSFLGDHPEQGPCDCRMVGVFEKDRLVAASFMDWGLTAASSVYAMFEPACAARSLGIFTLLLEIEQCRMAGLRWLYPGYATQEPSLYDYKKQFRGLETLDWVSGRWHKSVNAEVPA